jgi:ligand-binding sensor domain-containing protein
MGIVLGLAAGVGGPWAAIGLDFAPAAGVAADGLYRWDGAQWVLALPGQALRDILPAEGVIVQAVAEDAAGRLWLGTPSGLFHWQPGEPAPSGPDASLGGRDVRAVLALDHGELCIGATAGLFVGQAGALAEVEHWPGARVTCLAWEPAGQAIWCGTDAGLLRLARQAAGWSIESTYTIKDSGLAADAVTALAPGLDKDGQRCLWIGTPSGLSCFRLAA